MRWVQAIIPGQLQRFVARDFVVATGAVTAVLLLVIVGSVVGRVLRTVAEGKLPLDLLPALVALGSFKALLLFWPVALFLAFLLVLGRLQRDSELIAMQAGGVSFLRIYGALFAVAVPAAALLLVMMTWVVPRIELLVDQLRDRADQRSDLVGISPGRFLRSRTGQQVFFAETLTADRESLLNLFMFRERGEQMEVTIAQRATSELLDGNRYLILEHGHRYVGEPGTGGFQFLDFERLRMRVPDPTLSEARRGLDSLPLATLWQQRDNARYRAELEWRLALPLSILMLALVALPVGLMPPRSGRYARVPLGILVYVIYANFLVLGKSWLESGHIPLWLGLWWTHLIPLTFWVVLSWRQGLLPLRSRSRELAR